MHLSPDFLPQLVPERTERGEQHNQNSGGPAEFPKVGLVVNSIYDVRKVHAVVAGKE